MNFRVGPLCSFVFNCNILIQGMDDGGEGVEMRQPGNQENHSLKVYRIKAIV